MISIIHLGLHLRLCPQILIPTPLLLHPRKGRQPRRQLRQTRQLRRRAPRQGICPPMGRRAVVSHVVRTRGHSNRGHGRTVDVVGREGEGGDAGAAGHFVFAHLPVHGFGGSPGEGHFFGDFAPHVGFESDGRQVSSFCCTRFGDLVPRSAACMWRTHLSYNLASLFLRSSSHSLRRSR
jgi:hypothetical protein